MHEESLVRNLLRQIAEIAAEHRADRVRHVEVEIGQLSGVEPELFRLAFARHVDELSDEGVRLTLQHRALAGCCLRCDTRYVDPRMTFRCPLCGASETSVTDGDQVRLLNVTLETAESAA